MCGARGGLLSLPLFDEQPVAIRSAFLSGGSCGRSRALTRDPVPNYDGCKKFKLNGDVEEAAREDDDDD